MPQVSALLFWSLFSVNISHYYCINSFQTVILSLVTVALPQDSLERVFCSKAKTTTYPFGLSFKVVVLIIIGRHVNKKKNSVTSYIVRNVWKVTPNFNVSPLIFLSFVDVNTHIIISGTGITRSRQRLLEAERWPSREQQFARVTISKHRVNKWI